MPGDEVGAWVCETNGFRFVYKWGAQLVHNTKCSIKCNPGFEPAGIVNRNVCWEKFLADKKFRCLVFQMHLQRKIVRLEQNAKIGLLSKRTIQPDGANHYTDYNRNHNDNEYNHNNNHNYNRIRCADKLSRITASR